MPEDAKPRRRKRRGSPTITLQITDADRAHAIASNSGGCLIADALKRAGWFSPSVDMATIRVTDREEGKRYTYLTPPAAQHLLLSFDQAWPVEGVQELTLRRAVKVNEVTLSKPQAAARAAKVATLEAKAAQGELLTKDEKAALTKLRRHPAPRRPAAQPRTRVDQDGTIHGGPPIPQGKAHPNLLRGRNRIYGAKLADPGKAFDEAVEAAVRERDTKGTGATTAELDWT